MYTYQGEPLRLPADRPFPPLPVAQGRYHTIDLPIPDGVEIGDHATHDAIAKYYVPADISGYTAAQIQVVRDLYTIRCWDGWAALAAEIMSGQPDNSAAIRKHLAAALMGHMSRKGHSRAIAQAIVEGSDTVTGATKTYVAAGRQAYDHAYDVAQNAVFYPLWDPEHDNLVDHGEALPGLPQKNAVGLYGRLARRLAEWAGHRRPTYIACGILNV